jgi:hypothetical protein
MALLSARSSLSREWMFESAIERVTPGTIILTGTKGFHGRLDHSSEEPPGACNQIVAMREWQVKQ